MPFENGHQFIKQSASANNNFSDAGKKKKKKEVAQHDVMQEYF